MKKWRSILEVISSKFVCAIAVIILASFSFWIGVYTHMTYVDLENLKVRLYEDRIGANIGWLVIVAAVLFIISKIVLRKDENVNQKRVRLIAIAMALIAGVVSLIWVVIHNYVPDHDQLQIVVNAKSFLDKDYSDLKGYLEIFPYQIGLVYMYKILFSFWANVEIIYFVHVIWIMVIVYFTYAVTEELFGNSIMSLYSIFGAISFVPMYFYVNYAYGDLSMAALGVLGIWGFIKLCKSGKGRWAFFLIGVMTVSFLARSNAMIVMIAMFLVLFVYGISLKNWRMLLVSVLLIGVPLVSQQVLLEGYQRIAKVEMVKGSPAVLSVAMGMQDTYEGPGYYNAYNLTVYVNAGKNAEAAAKIGKEYVSDRIQEFSQNLSYAKNFYLTKIWQQWNEPSFGGEVSTKTFAEEPEEFVQYIYFGKGQEFLRIFRNRYIFILYAGAFLGAVHKLLARKEDDSIWTNLIFVILIGGFLFSILWENKSRYVMPYVVMLIPYSLYGLYHLQLLICRAVQTIKKKVASKRKV